METCGNAAVFTKVYGTRSSSDAEQAGQYLPRLAEHAVVERRAVRGLLWTDIDGADWLASEGVTLTGPMHEARGGMNDTRGTDDGEYRATTQFSHDAFHLERNLAEPHDVRPNVATAVTARQVAVVGVSIDEGRTGAAVAPGLEQLTVHMNQASRAGLLVKIIDVLSAEKEAVAELTLDLRERQMRGIRLTRQGSRTTHGIELPDQLRIAGPGLGRRYLLESPAFPKTIGITKSGDTALGTDAGARQNKETIGLLKRNHN